MTSRIGYVGLGAIGSNIASNLQKYFNANGMPPLLVYNRTAAKAQPVVDLGAVFVPSLAQLSSQCRVIFSCVFNDDALQSVFAECEPHLHEGAVFNDMSTVLPSTANNLAARAESRRGMYVSSPVFGRPDAAAAGKLLIVVAGSAEAKAIVSPLLTPVSRALIDVGAIPGQANTVKLMGNFFISGMLETIAETMTFGEKNGITRESYMDWLNAFSQVLPSVVTGYASRMATDQFSAAEGFPVHGGLKDVGNVRKVAEASSCPVPLADLIFTNLMSAKANGRIEQDWGSLITTVRTVAGLPAERSNTNPEKDT